MIALHHGGPYGHSASVLLLLGEKGQEFADHPVDPARFGEHDPAFLALNPEGMVPVLVADGKPLTETAFILHYIDERFPEPRFEGAPGKEHYLTHEWDKYVEGTSPPRWRSLGPRKGRRPPPAMSSIGCRRNAAGFGSRRWKAVSRRPR
jgi:glutathione S-transferase